MAKPKRIGGPNDFEHECLYLFYERLERRERLRRIPQLAALVLVVSVPVVLSMFGAMSTGSHEHQIASTRISPQ